MTKPQLEPPVADAPPQSDTLTDYDRLHLVTYLRLLDAEADGADPDEVARIVLGIDPVREPERARQSHAAHLARAHWMSNAGYKELLRLSEL